MLNNEDYGLNDIVEMKKKHPCRSNQWEILRLGADIKIKCTGCGHIVMIPRVRFNRMAKKVMSKTE